MTSDVVVIGGGIVGAAAALRFAQRHLRVALIDRGDPGNASRAAGGILCAQIEAHGSEVLLSLFLRAEEAHVRLAAELGAERVGYRARGVLRVAGSSAEADELETERAHQRRLGLPVTELGPAELRECEPALSSELLGASLFERGAQVDSRRLVDALYAEARRCGVQIHSASAEGLAVDAGRVTGVRLGGETLAAPIAVLAAGAWSSVVTGTGLASATIRPVRGQVLELSAIPPTLSRVVFGAAGYLVPRGDRVLVGSTMEEVGFAGGVTDEARSVLRARAGKLCPQLMLAPETGAWFGFRPATADGLPAIGPTPIEGLHLAVGFLRNGVLLAPLAAEAIVAAAMKEPAGPAIPKEIAAARLLSP